MLKKRILPVLVASTIAISNVAAFTSDGSIDLDSSSEELKVYALEVIDASDLNGSLVEIDDSGNPGALDMKVELGFSIGVGTSKYIRFDLTSATFGHGGVTSASGVSIDSENTTDYTVTLSSGGTEGDSSVIYEVSASGAQGIESTAIVTFDLGAFVISTNGTAGTAQYRLYETASEAANDGSALKDVMKEFAVISAVSTGVFSTPNTEIATIDSEFKAFQVSALGGSETSGALGILDLAQLLGSEATFALDSSELMIDDLLTDSTYRLTLNGNNSFGEFELVDSDDGNCASVDSSSSFISDENGALTTTIEPPFSVDDELLICVNVDGDETIQSGDYSLNFMSVSDDDFNLNNDIGTIVYDTTSIDIPYLTTFSNYNQRIYIVNKGTNDANYRFSFTTESGVTAENGSQYAGSVPKGEVLALKASNIVTLSGGTRTSARLELEALSSDIQVATQTVNLKDGSTDTVVLSGYSSILPQTDSDAEVHSGCLVSSFQGTFLDTTSASVTKTYFCPPTTDEVTTAGYTYSDSIVEGEVTYALMNATEILNFCNGVYAGVPPLTDYTSFINANTAAEFGDQSGSYRWPVSAPYFTLLNGSTWIEVTLDASGGATADVAGATAIDGSSERALALCVTSP